MDKDYITFSFGANWQSFLKTVTSERIESAQRDIVAWLGKDAVRGKTVLDIGCGSGIHSLVFYMLGAQEIVSFDYDQKSVEATQSLWKKVNRPSHWKILQGSVLDKDFIQNLGQGFDIVYAWGVLHHTGAMWEAIENSCVPVKKNGRYWIALYAKGPRYQQDLALKRRYNNASYLTKKYMVLKYIANMHIRPKLPSLHGLAANGRLRELLNILVWKQKEDRGMNTYHDIIDWLGGLPYEVASPDELTDFMSKKGFELIKSKLSCEGGNSIYLFSISG